MIFLSRTLNCLATPVHHLGAAPERMVPCCRVDCDVVTEECIASGRVVDERYYCADHVREAKALVAAELAADRAWDPGYRRLYPAPIYMPVAHGSRVW